ncbi:MAG: DUF2085 domain-containing protein [Candidatus Anstonellaceae archaeon]
MSGSKLPYILFFVVLFGFNALYFATAYLASIGHPSADFLYPAFGPTCHQLISRSLCLYKSDADGSYSIGDCLQSSELSYSKATKVVYDGKTGYKIPVCSRDVAIYTAMLAGLLVLPLVQKIDSEDWPNKWILVAAAMPTAVDGFTQLFGWRESTNFLRLITGVIIGAVLPFYILPTLNSLYSFILEKIGKEKKQK